MRCALPRTAWRFPVPRGRDRPRRWYPDPVCLKLPYGVASMQCPTLSSLPRPRAAKEKARRGLIPRRIAVVVAAAVLAITLALRATNVDPSIQRTADDVSVVPASTCDTATDSTATLQTWINSQPATSTLTMPKDACWNVDGTITIESKTGLTINANGSTFIQENAPTTAAPILQLWIDTNLTIKNLTIHGALSPTGSNNGISNEGDYGVQIDADTNFVLSGVSMDDIQGDFIDLSPPYDVDTVSDAASRRSST